MMVTGMVTYTVWLVYSEIDNNDGCLMILNPTVRVLVPI
jgi:hypothetical protein